MAEIEEKLKSFVMKMKEESGKAGLKLNIQKTNVTASSPITSWQIDGERVETVINFIFYAKAFDCVDHNKLWKILKEMVRQAPDLPLEKPVSRLGSNS